MNRAAAILGPTVGVALVFACGSPDGDGVTIGGGAAATGGGVTGLGGGGTSVGGGVAGDAGTVDDAGEDGPSDDAAATCPDCIRFHVSAPVPVLWTGGSANVPMHVPDNLFTVVRFPDHYVGYVDNNNSYSLSASTLLGLHASTFNATPVLEPGLPGSFDDCGAWLHGATILSGTTRVLGFYHAEGGGYCNGAGGGTHTKSIAYVVSDEGGLHFPKAEVDYPDNVILTGSADELLQASTTNTVGVGDFTVIEKDGYYYLFYLNALKAESSVARATIASGAGPGTWSKWYEGSFSQPGIGGEDSGLGLQLAGVSYSSVLNRFVGLTYGMSGTVGFKVAISEDGTSWTILDAPLVPGGTRWADAPTAPPNGGVTPHGYSQYQTIIAPDGSKIWSDTFYLYYLYIRPGEDFTMRFMARSEVKMEVDDLPLARPKASTSLRRYFSAAAQKHWVTSALAVPTVGTWDFQHSGDLGGVYTSAGPGLVELEDCVYDGNHYLVSVGACGSGATKLRTVGWLHANSQPQPAQTHGIYRCYDSGIDSHFVSVSADCEGATAEGLLGYALDP